MFSASCSNKHKKIFLGLSPKVHESLHYKSESFIFFLISYPSSLTKKASRYVVVIPKSCGCQCVDWRPALAMSELSAVSTLCREPDYGGRKSTKNRSWFNESVKMCISTCSLTSDQARQTQRKYYSVLFSRSRLNEPLFFTLLRPSPGLFSPRTSSTLSILNQQ